MMYHKIFPLDTFPAPKYVVTFARYQGQWLFSRHRLRTTWETQGGHIEEGETPWRLPAGSSMRKAVRCPSPSRPCAITGAATAPAAA